MSIPLPALDTLNNKLIFAFSPSNIQYVRDILGIKHILDNNPSGDYAGRYKCILCDNIVYANRNNTRQWHFSHGAGTSCKNIYGKKLPHMLSIYLLYDMVIRKLPITVSGSKCVTCSNYSNDITIDYIEHDTPCIKPFGLCILNKNTIRYAFIFKNYYTPKSKILESFYFLISHSDNISQSSDITFRDNKIYQCSLCKLNLKSPILHATYSTNLSSKINYNVNCDGTGLCIENKNGKYVVNEHSCCKLINCEQCGLSFPLFIYNTYHNVCIECYTENYLLINNSWCNLLEILSDEP